MQIGVMISNNSPRHSAAYWAETTAGQIAALVDVDALSSSEAANQARRDRRKFEGEMIDGFEALHQQVQDHETKALAEKKHERLKESVDPDEHLPDICDQALQVVAKAAGVNPLFAQHFETKEVQQVVRDVIRTHFASAMDIERSSYSDANLGHPEVEAWRHARRLRGAAHAHVFSHPDHGVVSAEGKPLEGFGAVAKSS